MPAKSLGLTKAQTKKFDACVKKVATKLRQKGMPADEAEDAAWGTCTNMAKANMFKPGKPGAKKKKKSESVDDRFAEVVDLLERMGMYHKFQVRRKPEDEEVALEPGEYHSFQDLAAAGGGGQPEVASDQALELETLARNINAVRTEEEAVGLLGTFFASRKKPKKRVRGIPGAHWFLYDLLRSLNSPDREEITLGELQATIVNIILRGTGLGEIPTQWKKMTKKQIMTDESLTEEADTEKVLRIIRVLVDNGTSPQQAKRLAGALFQTQEIDEIAGILRMNVPRLLPSRAPDLARRITSIINQ